MAHTMSVASASAGAHAAERSVNDPVVRLVFGVRCHGDDRRPLLGHFLAHVDRPRHVLDASAPGHSLRRDGGRHFQRVPDSIDHVRQAPGSTRTRR